MTAEHHCPGCCGERVSESHDVLPRFAHAPACGIPAAEAETLREDRARHRRRGTTSWHRPATDTERALVRAAGVQVEDRAPLFARVSWSTPGVRVRTFGRTRLGALDAVPS